MDSVPRKAVTIGMKEILESRSVRMYLDWPWQATVVRKAVHGPVTAHFPASFLQTHSDAMITITREVTEIPTNSPK